MIKDPEPVYHFIREKLGISREAKISRPYSIKVGEREMMVEFSRFSYVLHRILNYGYY